MKRNAFLALFAALAVGVGAQAGTVVIGVGVANGDFQASGDSGTAAPFTFDDTPGSAGFVNLGGLDDTGASVGGAEAPNFFTSTGLGAISGAANNAPPTAENFGAFLVAGGTVSNVTGHTVAAEGEVFDASININGQFGGAAAFDDSTAVELILFTTTSGVVDASTLLTDVQVLATATQLLGTGAAADRFAGLFEAEALYTSDADDIGETVFLGVTLVDEAGAAPFSRIDNFTLEVTAATVGPTDPEIPEPASIALLGLGGLGMLVRRRK